MKNDYENLPIFNIVMHNCPLTFSKSGLACRSSVVGVLWSLCQ